MVYYVSLDGDTGHGPKSEKNAGNSYPDRRPKNASSRFLDRPADNI
jgi:hypothetical protein